MGKGRDLNSCRPQLDVLDLRQDQSTLGLSSVTEAWLQNSKKES